MTGPYDFGSVEVLAAAIASFDPELRVTQAELWASRAFKQEMKTFLADNGRALPRLNRLARICKEVQSTVAKAVHLCQPVSEPWSEGMPQPSCNTLCATICDMRTGAGTVPPGNEQQDFELRHMRRHPAVHIWRPPRPHPRQA